MPAYSSPRIANREITPEAVFLDRRRFLAGAAGLLAFGATLPATAKPLTASESAFSTHEKLTSEDDITSYNNFYEFGLGKGDPKSRSDKFEPTPWTISVDGMVAKPREFGLDDLLAFPLEERIYRMRCVEAWSMVIPWTGFPLSALLDKVEPLGSARYVAFETVVRPDQMPGQSGYFQSIGWPYVEGLRLDEARHPLTILALGLYGRHCPIRTARPCALSCRGNMASRASSRSCASG